ncbi:MAG TPA: hypothetical protein DDY71_05815 [Spirochaetia bacterium]|nr:MAG: hypothetical protein A2Y30_00860 [Spirochaetes bacterium GWE1_32_154]HBD95830.1 hypothetical protein [Spirochaetia bacterium]HBI37143.1 hypothetical protein [Spirochaetia bacterium]
MYTIIMKIRLMCFIFLFTFSFFLSSEDFENNFLGGYLDFEKLFLNMNGDYGVTFFPFLERSYGGRDLGLSGAFTGVADDVSTIEANPAGTSTLQNTELFFSHSKLYGDINYNALAYTMRFNELGFGMAVRMAYLPFTHYDMLGFESGSGIISYTIINFNGSYNFLRTYERFGLSLGTNIKLYIYGVPDTIIANQSSVNIAFDFGLLTRFNFLKFHKTIQKNFSVGLVVQNIGPFTENEPPPTSINLGFGYRPIKKLLITSDLHYMINYSEFTYQNWNYRAGVEVHVTDYFSFLGGVSIKSSPSASIGINLEFDQFRLTAVYNPDLVDLAQFSISGSIKFGDMGRAKRQKKIDDLYTNVLVLINESMYSEAELILNEILSMSPNYTPAKRTINMVLKHTELYKRIRQVIDESEQIFD